jgi:tetratricopeptide (TPR) repeat protein
LTRMEHNRLINRSVGMLCFVLFAAAPVLPAIANGTANSSDADAVDTSSAALLKRAYEQLKAQNFEGATGTLCQSIKSNGDTPAARRYLSYTLLQRGLPKEALNQIEIVSNPIGFDYFMRGLAHESMGEIKEATAAFQKAVEKEPDNDYFRTKAIKNSIMLSQYHQAAALSQAGGTTTKDSKLKKFYEDEEKHSEFLESAIAKDRPCAQPLR